MNKILKQIIDNKKITIFRHTSPDGDAIYSQLAMYEFLKTNFKNKEICLCGEDESLYVKVKHKKVSNSFIENSLAIVLDSANRERVDDKRFLTAKFIVKIDHHPIEDQYGNINLVDTKAVAACEVLYDLLTSKDFKKYKMTNKCGEYIFRGILTDSLNFKTSNTTAKTFKVASNLMSNFDIDLAGISYELFSKKKDIFDSLTKLRTYVKYDGYLAYAILEQKDLDSIGLDYRRAKESVTELGNILGVNVWCLFVYNNDKDSYGGSLRSRNGHIVNELASKYHGGGHPYAASVRDLSKKDLKTILKELSKIANK